MWPECQATSLERGHLLVESDCWFACHPLPDRGRYLLARCGSAPQNRKRARARPRLARTDTKPRISPPTPSPVQYRKNACPSRRRRTSSLRGAFDLEIAPKQILPCVNAIQRLPAALASRRPEFLDCKSCSAQEILIARFEADFSGVSQDGFDLSSQGTTAVPPAVPIPCLRTIEGGNQPRDRESRPCSLWQQGRDFRDAVCRRVQLRVHDRHVVPPFGQLARPLIRTLARA